MFHGKTVIDFHGHMSTPPQFRAFAYNLIALRTPGDNLAMTEQQMQGADRPPPADARLAQHRRAADLAAAGRDDAVGAAAIWSRTGRASPTTSSSSSARSGATASSASRSCRRSAELDTVELRRGAGTLRRDGLRRRDRQPGSRCRRADARDERRVLVPALQVGRAARDDAGRAPVDLEGPALRDHPAFLPVQQRQGRDGSRRCLLEQSDVFERYPEAAHRHLSLRRRAQPHGLAKGKPVDAVKQAHGETRRFARAARRSGGSVGIGRVKEEDHGPRDLAQNLFFDTCMYDPHFLAAAIKQRGVDRMVFGTEVPGSGSDHVQPRDSTRRPTTCWRSSTASTSSRPTTSWQIVHDNPLRMFPLLHKAKALAALAAR